MSNEPLQAHGWQDAAHSVSKYRASLIKEHVIEADGKGYVRLSTPHMAEYLRGSSW